MNYSHSLGKQETISFSAPKSTACWVDANKCILTAASASVPFFFNIYIYRRLHSSESCTPSGGFTKAFTATPNGISTIGTSFWMGIQ